VSAAVKDRLADVVARAGASDTDREAWLAERMGGVTATEIRDLFMRKITVKQLIDLKLGRRVDTFSGNQYTAWGKAREPEIAAVVASVYPIAAESRVFHAVDNPRFLASPDGLGVIADVVVSEIKTSKHDVTVGSPAFEAAGYRAQMTWAMRVIGAKRCLYVSERHDSDWQDRGGQYFEPAPLGLVPVMEWVEYDEALAKHLETIAVGFLVALDAARAGDAPEGVIDEELDTLALNYLRGLDAEKEGKALKESSYKAIVAMVDAGEPVVQESSLARVSWSPEVVEERVVYALDEQGARAAAPAGLYERLEQAQHDVEQAQEALAREQGLVGKHEASHQVEVGRSLAVVKKSALRVTAAKGTKEKAA
jgi:hypothetical protein